MLDWILLIIVWILTIYFIYWGMKNQAESLRYRKMLQEEDAKRLALPTKHFGKSNKGNVLKTKRKPIPQDVKDKVWNRDNGKCIQCGSSENLEFDHIIPISKGGANTYRNIQLLCEDCNRSKSDNIG